jgi:transcriptional regulator with XRE-family HTH domain
MWKKLLSELNDAGLSDNEIARRVGINQSTVSRLRNGELSDTAYQTGLKLQALHVSVLAEKQAA